MFKIKSLIAFSLLFLLGCKSIAPTPLLISDLVIANNQAHEMEEDCSLKKPVCDLEGLIVKIKETQEMAKNFIAADVKQPQGYDIYLEVSLIYASLGRPLKDELIEAERIARQFFEVQKASSGRYLTISRYYWALSLAEYSAWKINNNQLIFTDEEKSNLRLCYSEGNLALLDLEVGPKKIRLYEALEEVIKPIITTY